MATKTTTKASTPKRKRTSTVPPASVAGAVLDGATIVEPLSKTPTREAPKHSAPTHEDIAFRAFELYQRRQHTDGGALNDWLTAERELRAS